MSTPALLTRTPISPSAAETCSTTPVTWAGSATSPRAPGGLDARRAKLRHQRLDLGRGTGADADAVPGAAERERGGAADALGGTGDERGDRGKAWEEDNYLPI